MQSEVKTATTTAQLVASGGSPSNPTRVLVKVPAAGSTVFFGGADVTADTTAGTGGMPVAATETLSVDLTGGDDLYARVASGTQAYNVLRSEAT